MFNSNRRSRSSFSEAGKRSGSGWCCCCLPSNHCINSTWVVEEILAFGNRLRSTHRRDFNFWNFADPLTFTRLVNRYIKSTKPEYVLCKTWYIHFFYFYIFYIRNLQLTTIFLIDCCLNVLLYEFFQFAIHLKIYLN